MQTGWRKKSETADCLHKEVRNVKTKNAANRVDGFTVFSYIIVTLFMIAILIPFWNVLVISLTSSTEYIQTPILIFP